MKTETVKRDHNDRKRGLKKTPSKLVKRRFKISRVAIVTKGRRRVRSLEAAHLPARAVTTYGASLGLAFSEPGEAVRAVKNGFPVNSFAKLQKSLDVPAQVLSGVTHIAPRTLARRKKEGKLQSDESERVLRIGSLVDRAAAVLGGIGQARQWLKSPNKALGEKTPLDHADTEPGAREVENLLGRIEYGVFS